MHQRPLPGRGGRLWRALAADTGLTITECHFPPRTSKSNKIEHRLFSQVTMNWRGQPLIPRGGSLRACNSLRIMRAIAPVAEAESDDRYGRANRGSERAAGEYKGNHLDPQGRLKSGDGDGT